MRPHGAADYRRRRGTYAKTTLLAGFTATEILAEKRYDKILESARDRTRVGSGIDFEGIRDPVAVHNVVQLFDVRPQTILIADVHCVGLVLLEIADILIHEREGSV